jgi:DNA repair protein RecO (recombination protein O)
MAARSFRTEAVVLRSLRLGEADRILHVTTPGLGRIGAVARGVRKTTSKFGGRLEPLSHVELELTRGRGDLHTVTGVQLLASHQRSRDDGYRLAAGLVGAEAVLRLFPEDDPHPKAFQALVRFLELLDSLERPADPTGRPVPFDAGARDPLALAFQLKLLWVAGYLPHLASCAECGVEDGLVAFSPRAGGAVCSRHAEGGLPLAAETIAGMNALLRTPLAEAHAAALSTRAVREALAVVTASYEYHGGFRLRSAAPA